MGLGFVKHLLNYEQFAIIYATYRSVDRTSEAALNMPIETASIEYHRTSPQTILLALHPGTTNTHLSKPFQASVPPEKLFSVDRTVAQLLDVIAQVGPDNSGEFFNWDAPLPW